MGGLEFGHVTDSICCLSGFPEASKVAHSSRDHSSTGGCLTQIFMCFLIIAQKAAQGEGKSSSYADVSIKLLYPARPLGQLKGCRLQHAHEHPYASPGKADTILWKGRAGKEWVKLSMEHSCLP